MTTDIQSIDGPGVAAESRERKDGGRVRAAREGDRKARGAGKRKADARRRRWLSPLTRRILVLNLIPLGMLVGAILYMGEYRDNLFQNELDSLVSEGEIFASALAESAVVFNEAGEQVLDEGIAARIGRRLAAAPASSNFGPPDLRARLFSMERQLVVDTLQVVGAVGAHVSIKVLPPLSEGDFMAEVLSSMYDTIFDLFPYDQDLELYVESPIQLAVDYDEVMDAYELGTQTRARVREDGSLVLSVAVPVETSLQTIVGVLMLTREGRDIEAALRDVRVDVLQIFAIAIGLTIMLSFYLAGTIARPVRRLADAAERVRYGQGRDVHIPDFSERGDEIGDLSGSLRDMTQALYSRLDAIERFAADVAHEIKNPLASMRSAVETVCRVSDPNQQQRLLGIIQQDVQRLDRLITDISDASRLDAELSRAQQDAVDVGGMLESLMEIYSSMHGSDSDRPMHFKLTLGEAKRLRVPGIESRLMQVFQNIISNAISFNPVDATIQVSAQPVDEMVRVRIDDEGPGIPPGKELKIFERFYSERPEAEGFGNNSGLGLNISKQIVESQGGTVTAENRIGDGGKVLGARFTIWLHTG